MQLKKLFKPGNRNEREIIKSLIELNLMREKIQEMGDLGQHASIIATLLSYVAEDACRYVSQKSKEYSFSEQRRPGGGRGGWFKEEL